MSKAVRPLCLLLASLTIVSCLGGDGTGLDENGRPPTDGGGGGSSGNAVASWRWIQDNVFTPVCTACHFGASAPEGLRLDEANSYNLLVGVNSNEVGSLQRVDPGNPDDSYLVIKLEGTDPRLSGGQMPLNGPPYLDQATIDAIRLWIANGAPLWSPPRVTALTPAPGNSLTIKPTVITVSLSEDMNAATITTATFVLVRSGGDGTFGDGNEVAITPASVSLTSPTQATMDLTGVSLPDDYYQVTLDGAIVANANPDGGDLLDGEFTSTFPSGDGTAGGDFVATFTLAAPGAGVPPTVTDLTPLPGSTLVTVFDGGNLPGVVATFSQAIDGATVDAASFLLVRSGGDGTFGDGNEVAITPVSVSLTSPTQATMDLSAATLPSDVYQVTLVGTGSTPITDTNANDLDGEFGGTFPSGDTIAGGDFVATFTLAEVLPTWRSIQDNVFTPLCTACHIAGYPPPWELELTDSQSWGNLVNVASGQVPGLDRVTPGNPDDSYLIIKLEGTDPRLAVSRMPLTGPPYLNQATIDVIRQWITDGAPN